MPNQILPDYTPCWAVDIDPDAADDLTTDKAVQVDQTAATPDSNDSDYLVAIDD